MPQRVLGRTLVDSRGVQCLLHSRIRYGETLNPSDRALQNTIGVRRGASGAYHEIPGLLPFFEYRSRVTFVAASRDICHSVVILPLAVSYRLEHQTVSSATELRALFGSASPPDVRRGYAPPEAKNKFSGALPLVRAPPSRLSFACP